VSERAWFDGFIARHPKLSLHTLQALSCPKETIDALSGQDMQAYPLKPGKVITEMYGK